jgi:hypothetical protein
MLTIGLRPAGQHLYLNVVFAALEQVPIDWNRRSPMTGLDADDRSFPSESFQRLPKSSVRPSKSFRKRSISFQFLPKISPLNLDLSKAYDRNLRVCRLNG